jgi:hypothetical protein
MQGQLEAVRAFGQVVVAGQLQPVVHMPEGILVRHQLHEPLAAIGIEAEYVLACERARLRPYLSVVLVGEGVLRIQFEVVDLPLREHVHEIEKRLQGRDLTAAHVQHHPAREEVGVILDLARGEPAFTLAQHLNQGHDAVERPVRVTRHDVYSVVRDP